MLLYLSSSIFRSARDFKNIIAGFDGTANRFPYECVTRVQSNHDRITWKTLFTDFTTLYSTNARVYGRGRTGLRKTFGLKPSATCFGSVGRACRLLCSRRWHALLYCRLKPKNGRMQNETCVRIVHNMAVCRRVGCAEFPFQT